MGATSPTGVSGSGDTGKFTTKELAILANAPSILFTGIVHGEVVASPPANLTEVTFPYPLPGGEDNYVVMLTTISGGSAYVIDRDEDEDGNFVSFTLAVESECDVMYLVARVGSRPNL